MKKIVGHKVKLAGSSVEFMIPVNAFQGLSGYRRVTQEESDRINEEMKVNYFRMITSVNDLKPKIVEALNSKMPRYMEGVDIFRILLLGIVVLTHDPILGDFELHHMLKVTNIVVESKIAEGEWLRVTVMYGLENRPICKIEGEWRPIAKRWDSTMPSAWIEAAYSAVDKTVVDILHKLYEWKRSGEKPAAVITEVYEEEKAPRRYESREIGIKKTKNEIKK